MPSLVTLVHFKVVHETLEAKLGGDMNRYRNNNKWSIPHIVKQCLRVRFGA